MKKSEDSSSNDNKWAFESETVIKNEKIGIAVWIEINNMKTKNLRYSILLLEKNNNWEIKGGIIARKLSNSSSSQEN